MVYCTVGGDNLQISAKGGADNFRTTCFLLSPFFWTGLAALSSGNGPKVDPPLAELIPDMTESPDLLLERTRLC